MRTVLTTPLISDFLRLIAVACAKVLGWKFPEKFAVEKKAILLGAPHTSNWDFMVLLMTFLVLRIDVKWVGKHTLFWGPLGPIMRWLGGIPIDRRSQQNFVQQVTELFDKHDHLYLVIAPEGTRKPVDRWRTGFYFMAQEAKVPIVLSYLDYKKREVGVGGIEAPTGDVESDIRRYQAFYSGISPKNPENYKDLSR